MTHGDIDRDGSIDIFASTQGGSVFRLRADETTRTLEPVARYSFGAVPTSLDLADVNHDGFLDLVMANAGNESIGIALGNGTDLEIGGEPFEFRDY